MGRGEWGEAHILAHKAGYMRRVCVENMYTHSYTCMSYDMSRCICDLDVCVEIVCYMMMCVSTRCVCLVEMYDAHLVEISRSS